MMTAAQGYRPLPTQGVLLVEHPAQIKDLDKGIASLGGPSALKSLAEDPEKRTLALKFRPADRFEHPKRSSTLKTQNILIRCRPKINAETGKKEILARPVAMIKHTVRFRDLADYALHMHQSPFAARYEQVLATNDASVMATFETQDDHEPGLDVRLDMPPPPVFSGRKIPTAYNYLADAQTIRRRDAAKTQTAVVGQVPPRQFLFLHTMNDGPVPAAPSEHVHNTHEVQALVERLQDLFRQEPMYTRRKLANLLGVPRELTNLKFALAHVAYMWRQGPWRDVYCRFGVDPRQDVALRMYQAVYFTRRSKAGDAQQAFNQSHIFDGETLYPAARTFSLCDITDPALVQIIQRATLRSTCDPKDGWFRHTTITALRHVMRAKVARLIDGVRPSNADFEDVLAHADDPDPQLGAKPKSVHGAGDGAEVMADADEEDDGEGDEEDDDDEDRDAQMATQLGQAFSQADLEDPEFEVDFGSDTDDSE